MRPTSAPIAVGDIITDYSITTVQVERIEYGGFGLVALGPDAKASKMRALKTMRPDVLARNPAIRDLFVREALTWIGVWPHANVLTAQNVIEWNTVPYLVLDYAEHGTLRDLLRRINGPLSIHDALLIAQQIAAGLAYLHIPDPEHLRTEPLVHRDLKPENLLIQQAGQGQLVVISDFGLAKTQEALADLALLEDENDQDETPDPTKSRRYHTKRGVGMGAAAYMAPEQWEDAASAGPPADIYALGIILAELLLGNHPLLTFQERHTSDEWYTAHRSGPRQPSGNQPSGNGATRSGCSRV